MNTLISSILPASRRLMVPALLCLFYASPSFAMGDNSTQSKTPDCPSGQVYDSVSKQCVPDKTSSLSDQDKTNYAYHLAKKGQYQAALNLLDSLKNGNTAEAWNYRGYATRKLGRMKGLAIISARWRLSPTTPKHVNILAKRGW